MEPPNFNRLIFWYLQIPFNFSSLLQRICFYIPRYLIANVTGCISYVHIQKKQFCVFTHVASIYANLLEQKKAFTVRKEFNILTGLVWDTNMAAVSLFWDTNMAAMTSCENTQ